MHDNLDGFVSPFLRQQRMNAAGPHIKGRVLDFGCGVGLVCEIVDDKKSYVGVDLDPGIVEEAKRRFPSARFLTLDEMDHIEGEVFDTIVGLAVIEHLPDPHAFLTEARKRLAPNGRIVLTTPNPALDWAHGLGAKFGIFAKESHDEHQSLMGKAKMSKFADEAGLKITQFSRFLLGANQLAILETKVA